MNKIPLGKDVGYPQEYAPDVLFAVPRSEGRQTLDLAKQLPFTGKDVWNAWELSWLDGRGQPVVAVVTLVFDAASPNIVESKSLKLYLGSFAMSRVETEAELVRTIADDLSAVSGSTVSVAVHPGADSGFGEIGTMPGTCVDDLAMSRWRDDVDADLLAASGETTTGSFHSHLLRSLCPVTAQPDTGTVMIHYRGPRIDPVSFLEYVVSYRQHQDFHEACVERMFLDIKRICAPEALTVYARYTRRGGIDINPFRSDFEDEPANLRLWRQ